jgi:mono/diheme cytochrome c family protein
MPEGNGSRGHVSAARLLFLLGGLSGCAPAAVGPPSADSIAPRAETDPVESVVAAYTVEQATRGQRVFTTVCSVCHGRNEFTGPIFAFTWMAEPVGGLFQHISTNMPQDRPGSLSGEQYAAVVAYILQLNGRPSGNQELPADAELLGRMVW